jgi:redox-sensitive bicupin YhaK (pirin superfamily)
VGQQLALEGATMIDAICSALRFHAGGFLSAIAAPLAPHGRMRTVGPFTTIAHALPVTLSPGALSLDDDVRPHPHIGIAALSYLFKGSMTHRDTLGVTQTIEPGAVNWMVAGRGIVHSERYERLRNAGGAMHGLQIWLALSKEEEEIKPSFYHFPTDQVPAFEADGVSGRLLVGAVDGMLAPARLASPCYLQEIRLQQGARFASPDGHHERAIHVMSGALDCAGQMVEAGQTVVLAAGRCPTFTAKTPSQVLSFGGAPIGKRYMWWNFVSSDKHRLEAAKADWREGRFGLPPGDAQDFTPLPEDTQRPLFELNC